MLPKGYAIPPLPPPHSAAPFALTPIQVLDDQVGERLKPHHVPLQSRAVQHVCTPGQEGPMQLWLHGSSMCMPPLTLLSRQAVRGGAGGKRCVCLFSSSSSIFLTTDTPLLAHLDNGQSGQGDETAGGWAGGPTQPGLSCMHLSATAVGAFLHSPGCGPRGLYGNPLLLRKSYCA